MVDHGRSEHTDRVARLFAAGAFTAVVAALSGCGAAGNDATADRVRIDTLANGTVRVHSSADGTWSDEQRWRLFEAVRIGNTTGGGPEAFGDVRGLALDELGRVWVVDTEAVQIRVFDRNGEFVRSVGSEGEGPGELQYPNGIATGPDGRIHVFDPHAHRIAVFDTAGRHMADHHRVTGGFSFLWEGGFVRDSLLYDRRVGHGIVMLDSTFAERDTVPEPRPETSPFFSGPNRRGGRSVTAVPYLGRMRWSPGPDGHLWVAPGRPYRFDVLSLAGDTVRTVEREYDPVPVTEAERDSAETLVRERYAPAADLDLSRIPEHKPAVEELFFADDGHLWTRPYLPGDSTGHAFDVFDPEGRYLGRVASPVKFRRWPDPVVRDGYLYGVTVNELDVPYVVGLRIEEP